MSELESLAPQRLSPEQERDLWLEIRLYITRGMGSLMMGTLHYERVGLARPLWLRHQPSWSLAIRSRLS
jgi:hypothetical protein